MGDETIIAIDISSPLFSVFSKENAFLMDTLAVGVFSAFSVAQQMAL